MKKILSVLISLFFVIVSAAHAYDPRDYFTTSSTVKTWFDPTVASTCLTSTSSIATDGQGCATLDDRTVNNNDGSQTSSFSQPIVRTNIVNSLQVLEFNNKNLNISGLNAVVKNTSKIVLGGMVNFASLSDNNYLFRIFEATYTYSRVRFAIIAGKPSITATNTTGPDLLLFESTDQITANDWHRILFEVDTVANVGRVWVDGAALTNNSGATDTFPVAGAIPNTNGNEAKLSISGTGNFKLGDYFIGVGEFMDSTQRGDWDAALEDKFTVAPTATPTNTPVGPTHTPTRTPTPTNTFTPSNTPTITPTPTPFTISATIPYKTEWKDQWTTWSQREYDYLVTQNGWTNPNSTEAQNMQVAHYYDATKHMLTMPSIVGNSSLAAARIAVMRRAYRDNYVLPNNGAVNGYTNFSGGLRKDFEMFGDATSKAAVRLLQLNSVFANSPLSSTADPNGVTSDGGARENAYRIMTELDARALGFVGNPNLNAWIDQALLHLNIWTVQQSSSYVRPFMVALVSKALIQAYEEYPAYPNRSSITNAISLAYEYIWANCWVPYSISDPHSRAFKYTDRNVGNIDPLDLEGQPDLNGLIVPPMGWLYKQTGDTKWRGRGDEVFHGILTEYDGNFWVRGPYFGPALSLSLQGKKQLNQSYQWSDMYIVYGESTPITVPTITPTPTRTPTITPTPTRTNTPTATPTGPFTPPPTATNTPTPTPTRTFTPATSPTVRPTPFIITLDNGLRVRVQGNQGIILH